VRKLSVHADSPEALEALLDALITEGWQSDERVIQSVVHRRSSIHGTLRITQELKQKGMSAGQVADIRTQLKDTEFARAQGVWNKKFGRTGTAESPAEYARQGRFLAARGFSHDIVRRVLKSSPEENLDEDSI
jgi:regulatory protein